MNGNKRLKHGAANFQLMLFRLLESVSANQTGEAYSTIYDLEGKAMLSCSA
jgi:hypothetical protein